MPEGTLQAQIQTLQTALASIGTVIGQPMSGGATLCGNAPGAQVSGLQGQFSVQISGTFQLDASGALGNFNTLFGSLQQDAGALPTQALTQFQGQIQQASQAFSGNFVQQIQAALDAVQGISKGLPTDQTAVASALIDQIMRVLGSLDGPEAERIQSWIRSLEDLHRTLLPLIEKARNAPDPAAIVLQVASRSLESTLGTFGFSEILKLQKFLDGYLPNIAGASLIDPVQACYTAALTAYGQLQGKVNAAFPEFREAAVATADALNSIHDRVRPLLKDLNMLARNPMLQPHALERFLRAQLDKALQVNVQEVQKIDDPYNALLDKIDHAIEGINLDQVRTGVLGFFERANAAIDQVNIPSIGDALNGQLTTVENAVKQLEQGVSQMLDQIRQFFQGLVDKYRTLATSVGDFNSAGGFEFKIEKQLHELFASARQAIGGEAPSVKATLQGFEQQIKGFVTQLKQLLDPVAQAAQGVANQAVGAVNQFAQFLQGLNVPQLIEQLTQKVKEVVDQLAPIDFAVVTDPVIAGINENGEKLKSIDTSKLNAMLKEALAAALDVVIKINFSAEISGPLDDQFKKVKEVPKAAIDELQKRYEQAVAVIDQLKPDQLLNALFAAYDTIKSAVGSLSVAPLLKPLDDLHKQFLRDPLAKLKPSTLLKPAADAFHNATAAVQNLSGAPLIQPLNDLLKGLQDKVAAFDVTRYIDDLLAAIAKLKQDLAGLRPSVALAKLTPELTRLEGELDRFKPSVVFKPVTDLAAPLLQFLESIQQQTIQALFDLFRQPLALLDRLRPEALTHEIQQALDGAIGRLESLNIPGLHNQLKGKFFDLTGAVQAQAGAANFSAHVNLTAELTDPEKYLGDLVQAYNDVVAILRGLRDNVELPSLAALYDEFKPRLLAMLPPYARGVLDPEHFRRLMKMADPSSFVTALDTRFEAIKQKLIPVRPEEIAAQLDTVYETLLHKVEAFDLTASLNRLKDVVQRVKGVLGNIRVDFLARDIDQAIGDFKAIIAALDPSRFFGDLDAIHHDLEQVVEDTTPSKLLGGLDQALTGIRNLVNSIDPRVMLGKPIDDAFKAVEGLLKAVDFRVVLKPILDKLDELKANFELNLGKTEDAFDGMLSAARSALGGGGGAGAAVSVSAGASF